MAATLPTFLYQLRPLRPAMLDEGPTDAEQESLAKHFAYLEDLTQRGVVLMAGRTLSHGADTFGIVVLRADGEETARAIVEGDPAVKGGVMTARLHRFRVALLAKTKPEGWTA